MRHRYLENVTTLTFNTEKCIGCERCTEVCPHSVFEFPPQSIITDKKATITDKDSCMECGACALNCPANAIEVNAGVGCASAIIMSWFTGKEPTCGCSSDDGNNKKCC